MEFVLITFIPAERHLVTASGTAARGGSIIDIRPTNLKVESAKSDYYGLPETL